MKKLYYNSHKSLYNNINNNNWNVSEGLVQLVAFLFTGLQLTLVNENTVAKTFTMQCAIQ